MRNIIFLIIAIAIFSGCSGVKVNATMCDQIASDPQTLMIPQECRPYLEKDAQKAFDNKKDESESLDADILKFQH